MVTQSPMHVRQRSTGSTNVPDTPWRGTITKKIPVFLPPIQSQEEEGEIAVEISSPTRSVQATPQLLQIGTLLDDRLRLKRPLEVEIEQEGNSYIAACRYVDEFGYGESPMMAIDDLQATLAELYWALKEDQKRLGPHLAQIWERLREAVEER